MTDEATTRAVAVAQEALDGFASLGPRLPPAELDAVRRAFDAVRLERDALLDALRASGQAPSPPDPPRTPPVPDARAARELALHLEEALAGAYAQVVRDVPALRAAAAGWLSGSATRAVAWRASLGRSPATVSWPGLRVPGAG